MTNEEKTARAHVAADALIGQCVEGMEDVLSEAELDDKFLLEEFDMLAFLCEQCGWWHSTDNLRDESGKQLCTECSEDDDGDEE